MVVLLHGHPKLERGSPTIVMHSLNTAPWQFEFALAWDLRCLRTKIETYRQYSTLELACLLGRSFFLVGPAFVLGRSKLRWSTVLAQVPPQALRWPTVFSLAQVHQKPKELVVIFSRIRLESHLPQTHLPPRDLLPRAPWPSHLHEESLPALVRRTQAFLFSVRLRKKIVPE